MKVGVVGRTKVDRRSAQQSIFVKSAYQGGDLSNEN